MAMFKEGDLVQVDWWAMETPEYSPGVDRDQHRQCRVVYHEYTQVCNTDRVFDVYTVLAGEESFKVREAFLTLVPEVEVADTQAPSGKFALDKADLASFTADLKRLTKEKDSIKPNLAYLPKGLDDYSLGGLFVDLAKYHLDESLPNGQKERSELALLALEVGLHKLKAWMKAAGYEVHTSDTELNP